MNTNELNNIDFQNSTAENVGRVQKLMIECMSSIGYGSHKQIYMQQLKKKREEFFNNQDVWSFLYTHNGINVKICEEAWRISPKKAWEVLQKIEQHKDLYQQVAKVYREKIIDFSNEYDELFDKNPKRFGDIERSVENIARNIVDVNKNSVNEIASFMPVHWNICGGLISSYMYQKNFIDNADLEEELEGVISGEFSSFEDKNFIGAIKKIIQGYVSSDADLNAIGTLSLILEYTNVTAEDLNDLFKMGLVWNGMASYHTTEEKKQLADSTWAKYQSDCQNKIITQSIEEVSGHSQTIFAPVRKI